MQDTKILKYRNQS